MIQQSVDTEVIRHVVKEMLMMVDIDEIELVMIGSDNDIVKIVQHLASEPQHCVLPNFKDLAFWWKALRFVFIDLAFCLDSTAFCEEQFVVFCADIAFCPRSSDYVLPNDEALRKCILSGPYKPTTVLVQAVEATDDSLAIPEHTTVETPMTMSPENKAHFEAENEAIHLILTNIGDEIYLTIDACQTTQEIWEAIERNKNVDTTPWYKNDDHSGQFGNQRTLNVARAREKVGSPVAQQTEIQCFNCKEFRHFSKECRKPKKVKDSTYHKEKMLLCKQAKQGVSLQAEQYDWLADTDEEVDEQELEAHYNYMAKIQEVPTAETGTDSEPLEHVQKDAGYNVFANDLQHSEQSESVSNTCLVETEDSNVIPDSPDMCEDDIQNEQNDVERDD
nr:hypothetical protein [Tanacetum cinerariifolium]